MVSRFSREPIEDVLKTLIRLWDAGGAVAFCELGGKVLTGFDQQSGDVYVVIGAIQRARGEWLERQQRALGAARKKREAQRQGTYKPRTRAKAQNVDYPFWLDVNKDGEFVLNDNAAHVRTMFKLAPEMGVTRIASLLNDQGVRAFSDRRRRLIPNTVRWILRNEAVIGYKVFWDGYEPTGEKVLSYPPVVTQEEWDAAQTALNQRSQSLPSNNSPSLANLFAGSIFCRHCGSPMSLKASGGVPHKYLRCRNDYSVCTHRGHQYREDFLLGHLAQYRWEAFFNAGVQEAALTSARSSLIEAEKALRSVDEVIGKVSANMSEFITSDDPSATTVLLKAAQKLEELMADRNLAQLEVDNWKAEVTKLTHQQTGRDAERALKRQIDGFLSGQNNRLEQRVAFNNWLRDQDLVLCIEDIHDLVAASGESFPSDEMQAHIFMGQPVFEQGRLVMVNCLLETMKSESSFEGMSDGLMQKVHDHYQFESNRSDPAEFDRYWEHTVDKGWPAVDLIGVRTYEEHRFWQEFVDAGGNDPSATFDGGIGLIHHPLTYDTAIVGKWTSREKRKRGRPAKRKRTS